ncbi:MAG: ATP-binding protein [Methanobrevibacter sp.]|nr:ATP-binding protein [Methanobrevibacter sp.]
MDTIVDSKIENYKIMQGSLKESLMESYYHKESDYLGNVFSHDLFIKNNLAEDFGLSSFDLISHYMINDFKSALSKSKDFHSSYSYESLSDSYEAFIDDLDRQSPFYPGMPANPNCFIGRVNTLNHIIRYFGNVFEGRSQHFFLTGKRRMGKTSIIEFVETYMVSKGVVSVYVSNKGNDSVETLCRLVIETLLTKLTLENTGLQEKLKTFFKDYVESIEFKGTKLSFKEDDFLSLSFKEDFISHLISIFNEFGEGKKAFFIIVDDINGLSDSKEFAQWYKRTADTLAVSYRGQLPVYFLLAGYPEKFYSILQQEPSFGSIFAYEEIERLSDNEVHHFFLRLFDFMDIKIDDDALLHMVLFSMGQPLMMQQIGDSIFWDCSRAKRISKEDAINGIVKASNQLEIKQIKDILDIIYNENFHLIIESLISQGKFYFTKSDIEKIVLNDLGDDDKSSKFVFKDLGFDEQDIDNFIKIMLDLDSIEKISYKNVSLFDLNSIKGKNYINSIFSFDFDLRVQNDIYGFNNSLTFIYFWISF